MCRSPRSLSVHDRDYELDVFSDDAQRQMVQVGQFNADFETDGA